MDGVQTLYRISLIAAFIAGMIALFAPCCITYLLPAYFGNIFKEKRRILFMTLVYSFGIFVVMLPVVLGAKLITALFFQLHDQVYIIGGVFMLILAIISLLGIKLPMPIVAIKPSKNGNDVVSTFTLGVLSGITSSCCAPVLVGVMTLSSLSPTLLKSLGVGVSYVLGMVAPLYIASLFIERGNILQQPLLRKKIGIISLGRRRYPIFISNIIAAAIFFLTGGATLILTFLGKLSMPSGHSLIVKTINNIALRVTSFTRTVPWLNLVFAIIGIPLLYKLVREALKE